VVVKVHRASGAIGLPLGLEAAGLILQPRFAGWGPGDHAVIDTDHYVQQTIPVAQAQLRPVFEDLHESVAEVFRTCASAHAHRIWAGEQETS
jgi:uncharacterized protein (TIGR04255 family)